MKNFTKFLTIFPFLFVFIQLQAQSDLWKDIPESSARSANEKRMIIPKAYRTLSLDTTMLLAALKNAPAEFSQESKNSPLVIAIPMPNGTIHHFSIVEYSMMEPGLQHNFPDIRTYSGQGIEDPTATIKIDWTSFGFHAMILSAVSGSAWIDPYAQGTKTSYISYYKKDLKPKHFIEEVIASGNAERPDETTGGPCLGATLRTYRLAVACTGEYAVAVGGTTAALLHSAIVTSVNRVNGVYENEVAIRLTLVANNNLVEFLNPGTDLFTGNNNAGVLISESQTVINANIGAANYDIGHTFSTGGGGLAGPGVVCNNATKARGITGSPAPTGDGYDIDYVAHEIGHQFGGSHTFNATTGNCGGNGTMIANVEPGSGTTIMAYAGICLVTNDLSAHSDPQFHGISFDQIGTFSRTGGGASCGVATATGNTPPVVNAGINYTIPVSTPFTLTGSATDINGDLLTYSWEQMDIGGPFGNWNAPSGQAPLFRSFPPTISPSRTFPRMYDLANNVTTIGEILPSYVRDIDFRLTARDNRAGGGGVCYAEIKVFTSGATPFSVTSQAVATNWTANGSNMATITWTVAGTTVAPFNVSNVDILFSADGGLTFPFTLINNTANDGSESIIIPAASTTKGRVMVRARGNIFFDINVGMITISSVCGAEGAVVAPANTVTAPPGNPALNLGLSPQYSTALTPSGSLQTTDPASNLAVFNTATSGCQGFSNVMKYDQFTFTPSITATYTFTLPAGTPFPIIMNLYSNSFDPSNPCTNFLKSNGSYTAPNPVNIGSTITQLLTVGSTYTLIIGTFSITQPTLPAAYSVAVSSVSPAGGNIYSGSTSYFNPGAGFSYAYVIVSNVTNSITGISATSNLTNAGTYPAGSYSVYGLSYSNTILNLNSYVGGNFNTLITNIFNNPASFCANFSKNVVTVFITGPVPVNIFGLTAKKSGSKVLLEWKTSSEQNSDHFRVQRSPDASSFSTELERLDASGNSSTETTYRFTDVLPLNKWNYYRIEEVDIDGSKTRSNTAAVKFDDNGNPMLVYPNPAVNELTIEYNSNTTGPLVLNFIDSKGALVMVQTLDVVQGRSINNINIRKLSPGIYMLKYKEPVGNSSSIKFFKK